MSGSQAVAKTAQAGGHDHHADGSGHGSVKSYMVGFVLSVILTAIPFGIVMSGAVATATAVPLCIGIGVVQIVVHLIYFLHMNASSTRTWNMAAFVFTLIVVLIVVVGSLWVMHNMNANMMPGMMPTE